MASVLSDFINRRGQLLNQQAVQQQISQGPQRNRLLGLQVRGKELANTQQENQQARFTEESNLRSVVNAALQFQQVGNNPDAQNAFLNKRIGEISARGGDPTDTLNLLETAPEERAQVIENVLNIGRQRGIIKQPSQSRFAQPFAAQTTGGESVFVRSDPATGAVTQVQGFVPVSKSSSLEQQLLNADIDPNSTEGIKLQRQILAKKASSKGRRISFNPETGETVIEEGVGVGGAQGITKKTKGNLEKQLVTFERNISDLTRIEEQFKPEFLTFLGRGQSFLSSIKSKAGAGLDKDEKRFLQQRTRFTNNINQFFNRYRKDITGAAASVQELESLKKSMFNEDLSPAEFEASFGEFKSGVLRSRRLVRKLLREGIQGSLKDKKSDVAKQFNAQFLGGGDDDPTIRINEIRASGVEDREEIKRILKNEGYI